MEDENNIDASLIGRGEEPAIEPAEAPSDLQEEGKEVEAATAAPKLYYCLLCKTKTGWRNEPELIINKIGLVMMSGLCSECGRGKTSMIGKPTEEQLTTLKSNMVNGEPSRRRKKSKTTTKESITEEIKELKERKEKLTEERKQDNDDDKAASIALQIDEVNAQMLNLLKALAKIK